jgi:hypothetical protein
MSRAWSVKKAFYPALSAAAQALRFISRSLLLLAILAFTSSGDGVNPSRWRRRGCESRSPAEHDSDSVRLVGQPSGAAGDQNVIAFSGAHLVHFTWTESKGVEVVN